MAYELYVTVEGKTQGKFKGEIATALHKDKIGGLSFEYEVQSPRDPATGQASGKHRHSAITIVKEWGAATPQLFQALVTNEVLPKVTFEFFQVSRGTGKEEAFYRITLTDAGVSMIKQFTAAPGTPSGSKHGAAEGHELEAVSFAFQKIQVEHLLAKTAAQDDWKS